MAKGPQKKFKGPTEPKKKNRGNSAAKKIAGYRPKVHADTCSFCDKHKDQVPLMVRSNVTNATICSFCSMQMVEQTMNHMTSMAAAYKEIVTEHPEWFEQDPETKAISLVPASKRLDDAIDKTNGH